MSDWLWGYVTGIAVGALLWSGPSTTKMIGIRVTEGDPKEYFTQAPSDQLRDARREELRQALQEAANRYLSSKGEDHLIKVEISKRPQQPDNARPEALVLGKY
jgi:hypothetical protein